MAKDEANDLPDAVRQTIAEHHAQYLADPDAAHLWDPIVIGVPGGPVPCLLLWHTGRKSGKRRNSILQYYRRGDALAIVASKGGVADNPAWYLNLVAEPRCEVWVGSFKTAATARTVEGEERAEWWSFITTEQPQQLEYEQRTSRLIPVVVLDLAEGSRWPAEGALQAQ